MSEKSRLSAIYELATHPRTEAPLREMAIKRLATLAHQVCHPTDRGLIDRAQGLALMFIQDGLRGAADTAIKTLYDQARTGAATRKHKHNTWTGWQLPEISKGEKYDRSLTLPQIAGLLRAEIKLSRKIAEAPAGGLLAVPDPIADAPQEIKYSVTSSYKGHGSVRIVLKNVPKDWAWRRGVDPRDPWNTERWLPTDALQKLLDHLNGMLAAYNFDGSDAQVDYFHVNFYGHAEVDWREIPRG